MLIHVYRLASVASSLEYTSISTKLISYSIYLIQSESVWKDKAGVL